MKSKTKRKIKNFINSKEFEIKLVATITCLMLLILSFFFNNKIEKFLHLKAKFNENQVGLNQLSKSKFLVEYIDVGQGNACFVQLPDGKTLLIDGGNTSSGKTVSDYLKSRGVNKIDYMIGTHADADHIGGLSYVLETHEVKNIYRPFQISGTGTNFDSFEIFEDEDLADVYSLICYEEGERNKISRVTTNVYKRFISGIYSETYTESGKSLSSKVTVFYDGLKITGKDYELEFYAPFNRDVEYKLSDYSNTFGYATKGYGSNDSNGNSAIFTIKIFDNIFFFSGDAPFSSGSNKDIVENGYAEQDFVNSLSEQEKQNLTNVSVFLIGHHGSSYSSGEMLLSLLKPDFAVLSVGSDNTYGHPNSNAIKRVEKYKQKSDIILSTIESGDILFGEVNGELKYVLGNVTSAQNVTISWYMLGSIIFIFIETFIIFIKPYKKQGRKWWL